MKPRDLDRLRDLLHRGDPAGDGREPDETEARRRRAELLAARLDPPRRRPLPAHGRLLPAGLAAAALLAVALGIAQRGRDGAGPPAPAPAVRAPAAAAAPPRQIHFTTAGGTRVVWLVYPEEGGS